MAWNGSIVEGRGSGWGGRKVKRRRHLAPGGEQAAVGVGDARAALQRQRARLRVQADGRDSRRELDARQPLDGAVLILQGAQLRDGVGERGAQRVRVGVDDEDAGAGAHGEDSEEGGEAGDAGADDNEVVGGGEFRRQGGRLIAVRWDQGSVPAEHCEPECEPACSRRCGSKRPRHIRSAAELRNERTLAEM